MLIVLLKDEEFSYTNSVNNEVLNHLLSEVTDHDKKLKSSDRFFRQQNGDFLAFGKNRQ